MYTKVNYIIYFSSLASSFNLRQNANIIAVIKCVAARRESVSVNERPLAMMLKAIGSLKIFVLDLN